MSAAASTSKPDWFEFVLLALLLIGTRALDLWVTWAYSPDLGQEANPLISVVGLSWPGLLGFTVVLCGVLLGLLHYDLFGPRTVFPAAPDLGFREFADLRWFGRRRALFWYLLALARDHSTRAKFIGFAGTRLLILVGLLAFGSWVLQDLSPRFAIWYADWYPWYPYGLVVIGAVFFLYRFLRREYALYQATRGREGAGVKEEAPGVGRLHG